MSTSVEAMLKQNASLKKGITTSDTALTTAVPTAVTTPVATPLAIAAASAANIVPDSSDAKYNADSAFGAEFIYTSSSNTASNTISDESLKLFLGRQISDSECDTDGDADTSEDLPSFTLPVELSALLLELNSKPKDNQSSLNIDHKQVSEKSMTFTSKSKIMVKPKIGQLSTLMLDAAVDTLGLSDDEKLKLATKLYICMSVQDITQRSAIFESSKFSEKPTIPVRELGRGLLQSLAKPVPFKTNTTTVTAAKESAVETLSEEYRTLVHDALKTHSLTKFISYVKSGKFKPTKNNDAQKDPAFEFGIRAFLIAYCFGVRAFTKVGGTPEIYRKLVKFHYSQLPILGNLELERPNAQYTTSTITARPMTANPIGAQTLVSHVTANHSAASYSVAGYSAPVHSGNGKKLNSKK